MFKNSPITSPQNPYIKNIIKLRNRRQRDKQKTLIIEGYRSLARSWEHLLIEQLYICPEFFQRKNERQLIKNIAHKGAQVFELPSFIFEKISYRNHPEGLLGLATYPNQKLSDIKLSNNAFLVVTQAIEKPGNLGAIIRSSDATGTDGLIVCDKCTDIFNPNVINASTGICFSLPIVETTTQQTLDYLKKNNIKLICATPSATKLYNKVDLTHSIAIVVGAEQYGLTQKWLEQATVNVRIPMLGCADSLNVASTTTILLYEAIRQRREKGLIK